MRIAEVIGHVTLSKGHPSLEGARWLIAVPLPLKALMARRAESASSPVIPAASAAPPVPEDLVVYDELGAGIGSLIGISEGTEASMPFRPDKKPVDAYAACLLDSIHLEASAQTAG